MLNLYIFKFYTISTSITSKRIIQLLYLIILQGVPAIIAFAGTCLFTSDCAPITAPSSICAPFNIEHCAPIHTSSPMVIPFGAASSACSRIKFPFFVP